MWRGPLVRSEAGSTWARNQETDTSLPQRWDYEANRCWLGVAESNASVTTHTSEPVDTLKPHKAKQPELNGTHSEFSARKAHLGCSRRTYATKRSKNNCCIEDSIKHIKDVLINVPHLAWFQHWLVCQVDFLNCQRTTLGELLWS